MFYNNKLSVFFDVLEIFQRAMFWGDLIKLL